MSKDSKAGSTEEAVIHLFKSGNRKAFDQLYDTYAPMLFGVICRILGNNKVAEQVLQQSFVELWQEKGQYNTGKERIFFWMLRCAKKNSLLAKSTVENEENISHLANQNPSGYVTVAEDGSLSSVNNQNGPDQQAEERMLDLLYIRGYSLSDVRAKLNLNDKDIRVVLKKAIGNLKVKAVA